MEPEGKVWSNEEILQYVLTDIIRKAYERVHTPEFYERLRELFEENNTLDIQRALINIQTGPLLNLFYYLSGGSGPSTWPGIDLVNAETRESLSSDFLMSFAASESTVDDEFDPPLDIETARFLDSAQMQELWEQGLCPTVTGVIFGNDQICHLDLSTLAPTPFPDIDEIGRVIEPTIANRSNVKGFITNNGEDFTVLDELVREQVHARNLALVAGATSMGSEGFVAVLTLDTREIIWIAIFANSNPFVSVSYDASNDAVIAITSHEHVWKFPLTQPEKLQVSYLNW